MSKVRFVTEGFKGFARNRLRSVASIVILTSSLLLIGIFTTVMLVIDRTVGGIDDFNKIFVYMDLDADSKTVEATGDAIRAMKNVKAVTYIPKAQALESERAKYHEKYGDEYDYIFDSYSEEDNPLPDTFQIEYESVDDIDAIRYNLENGGGNGLEGIDKVVSRYDIAKNIRTFRQTLSIVGTWFMVLLVCVSVFVISSTVKLTYHYRKLEITVMRYIGATKRYITMPFMFEGAIVGFLSGLIGYLVQYYLYAVPIVNLAKKYSGFIIVPSFAELNIYYLIIYFAAGTLFGLLGSTFATRKYMKV